MPFLSLLSPPLRSSRILGARSFSRCVLRRRLLSRLRSLSLSGESLAPSARERTIRRKRFPIMPCIHLSSAPYSLSLARSLPPCPALSLALRPQGSKFGDDFLTFNLFSDKKKRTEKARERNRRYHGGPPPPSRGVCCPSLPPPPPWRAHPGPRGRLQGAPPPRLLRGGLPPQPRPRPDPVQGKAPQGVFVGQRPGEALAREFFSSSFVFRSRPLFLSSSRSTPPPLSSLPSLSLISPTKRSPRGTSTSRSTAAPASPTPRSR